MNKPHKSGFTLIELLVVIGIIGLLAGMAMPMVTMAGQRARQAQTQVVLRTVETALRQFRADLGVYPYQATYPDLEAGENFSNRLQLRLGRDLLPAAQLAVRTDMDTAADRFDDALSSSVKFTDADMGGFWPRRILANRMARERSRLAVLSGNLRQEGPIFNTTNRSSTSVLDGATVASASDPGWSTDYLAGAIEPRFIDAVDGSLRDAWRHPLIYICQVVPGVQGSYATIYGNRVDPFDSRYLGLGAQGFPVGSGPSAALISAGRVPLLYGGRVRLSHTDAGDGLPTPADPTWFPDTANLLHSDLRWYAAAGFETEFELWSAGRDGRYDWMRDDALNRDNISATDTQRGLK